MMDLLSEHLWTAVIPGYETYDLTESFKTLCDLCAEKLVSDVYLFRNLTGLPKRISTFLLIKALMRKRTLSISQLLKYYKDEDFKLPIPSFLTNLTVFTMDLDEVRREVRTVLNNAQTVLSTFFCLIEGESTTSQLRNVDLNEIPMDANWVEWINKFISNRPPRRLKDICYTVKLGLTVRYQNSLELLKLVKEKEDSTNVSIKISGLHLMNNYFEEACLLEYLEKIDIEDLVVFSLHFSAISPSSENTFAKLGDFSNLRALNLTYLCVDFANFPSLLRALAQTLHDLLHLTCISLRGCKLTGCLQDLFKQFCKKNNCREKRLKTGSVAHCCIIHRETLQYLDVSACELAAQDLICFRGAAISGNLKYLNISYNRLDARSLSSCLRDLHSSLIVLEMEHCIPKNTLLEEFIHDLISMEELKSLNIRGLHTDEDRLQTLAFHLKTMKNLQVLNISPPSEDDALLTMFQTAMNERRPVNVSWG